MNTTTKLSFGLAGAALIACLAPATTAQEFSAADVARNRAIAASPRGMEACPWLARGLSSPDGASLVAARAIPADLTGNRALASSPRMLEEFPELARQGQAARPATATPARASGVSATRALAASPRALEEFPELGRPEAGAAESRSFQVAPLK